MTIDEILEEGQRLHAEHAVATMVRSLRTADMLSRFYSEHGPALLTVCRLVVEWDARQEEMAAGLKRGWDRPAYVTADINLTNARCALRAAVRGDAGGEG